MSIQTKVYKSRKTGKESVKYYAVVYDKKKDRTIWSKGLKTEREAKREEARILRDLEEGTLTTVKMGFSEITKSWFESSMDTYANSTYQGYVWYTKHYIEPVFSGKPISDIEAVHLQKYVNELSKYLAAETVNKTINILSNIFQHAITLEVIKKNPMQGIKRKKVSVEKCITWSVEEIRSFLSFHKVVQSNYYELLLLSFITGMRPSEVCGIYRSDLCNEGTLRLSRGYDRYGVISDMKTSNSHRSLQLDSSIYEILLQRIKRQALQESAKGTDYCKNEFMFKQANGEPINPSAYSKAFKRLLREYNKQATTPLPDTSLYSASRHSFGTNLIVNEKVPTSIVSSIMGNSERVLTSRYVHVKDEKQTATISAYTSMIVDNKVS